jgi:hypothetical protein
MDPPQGTGMPFGNSYSCVAKIENLPPKLTPICSSLMPDESLWNPDYLKSSFEDAVTQIQILPRRFRWRKPHFWKSSSLLKNSATKPHVETPGHKLRHPFASASNSPSG